VVWPKKVTRCLDSLDMRRPLRGLTSNGASPASRQRGGEQHTSSIVAKGPHDANVCLQHSFDPYGSEGKKKGKRGVKGESKGEKEGKRGVKEGKKGQIKEGRKGVGE